MSIENELHELTAAIHTLIEIAVRQAGEVKPVEAKPRGFRGTPKPETVSAVSQDEPAKEAPKAEPVKEAPKAEPVKEAPNVAMAYASVKTAVLEVSKVLGREAAFDLLAPFGVVEGEGEKRQGKIARLKPDQYEGVLSKARELLAGQGAA